MNVLVTVTEASRILSVNPTTVYYMKKVRTLKASRSRPWRFSLADVERLRVAREGRTKTGRRSHGVEIVTGGK